MKTFICLAVFSLSFTVPGFTQPKASKSKAYWTSGGELIFSFANVEQNGNSESSTLRFSPPWFVGTRTGALGALATE